MIKKTAALLTTGAIAASTLALLAAPAQADDWGYEREKTKRCSMGAYASLSVEKEYGRIDVDFDIENAEPGRSWNVTVKHNGSTVVRTNRSADYEGELDVWQQVRDRAGKDRFVARATGPNGQVCSVKLSF